MCPFIDHRRLHVGRVGGRALLIFITPSVPAAVIHPSDTYLFSLSAFFYSLG